MTNIGNILKKHRLSRTLKLSEVSKTLKIDNALVSKIERGDRLATKKQILLFIDFYLLDKKAILIQWLSEKIIHEIQDQENALEALYAAEEQIKSKLKNLSHVTIDGELKALLQKVDSQKQKNSSIGILEKSRAKKIQEHFRIYNTFETNRIEGHPFTLTETDLVIKEGLTINGKTMVEHLTILNHYDALEYVEEWLEKRENLTEEVFKELHYLLLKGIDRKGAGVYRSTSATKNHNSQQAPEPLLVPKKMEAAFEYYQQQKNLLHPVILAANMHDKIIHIYPFKAGNAMVCRLLMNLILLKNAYPITTIKGDSATKLLYFNALNLSTTNHGLKAFHLFIAQATLESLDAYYELAK